MKISDHVEEQNSRKILFTAGPASLLPENLTGLQPCFGRGDAAYLETENQVLDSLRAMTGHRKIARMQGSGSLAIEIMVSNFLYGEVLIVESGYYSERIFKMAVTAKDSYKEISEITYADLETANQLCKRFDWVVACSTETSRATLLQIRKLRAIADACDAKLMLDATASIGLEDNHDLADVLSYSSCKGLFGLTGAAFVAFNEDPSVEIPSFYLSLSTHINKGMTGPYHAICSLADVLPQHETFAERVKEAKARFIHTYSGYLVLPPDLQPNLCTWINTKVQGTSARVVLYEPRALETGSVVCHLGGVHLSKSDQQDLLQNLKMV